MCACARVGVHQGRHNYRAWVSLCVGCAYADMASRSQDTAVEYTSGSQWLLLRKCGHDNGYYCVYDAWCIHDIRARWMDAKIDWRIARCRTTKGVMCTLDKRQCTPSCIVKSGRTCEKEQGTDTHVSHMKVQRVPIHMGWLARVCRQAWQGHYMQAYSATHPTLPVSFSLHSDRYVSPFMCITCPTTLSFCHENGDMRKTRRRDAVTAPTKCWVVDPTVVLQLRAHLGDKRERCKLSYSVPHGNCPCDLT